MRINKLLSNLGICSRKEANRIIEEKRITVNGILCIPGQWVEEEDIILMDNKPLLEMEKVYIVLNKPVGVICTAARDIKENIIDYINFSQYIFPVGRLDKASQGLIILTNDGELANKILNADNKHEKEYIVTVNKQFDYEFINKMEMGVDIGGIKTRECVVKKINENTFKIILTQGLNRQIRRMTKALGYEVIRLERIRVLNIKIDDLKLGAWRELTFHEVEELRNLQ